MQLIPTVNTVDSAFQENLLKIIHGDHYDPHAILGLHHSSGDQKVIRLWRPGATEVFLEVFGEIVHAKKIHDAGFFEYVVPSGTMPNDYKVFHQNGQLTHDPYAFLPTVGEVDQYLFGKGVHYHLYSVLGARVTQHQGVQGVKFAVWAPAARRVSLIGDFNYWDGR